MEMLSQIARHFPQLKELKIAYARLNSQKSIKAYQLE